MRIRSSISLSFLVLSLSACGSSPGDPGDGVDGGSSPGDAAEEASDARVVTGPCATLTEGRNSGFSAGGFARDFIQENRAGNVSFNAMRRQAREHPVEEVGARLRGLMPWLTENALVDRDKN